jgi:hypothetical protein
LESRAQRTQHLIRKYKAAQFRQSRRQRIGLYTHIMAPSLIVVGASGNFGPFIVQALISHKAFFNRIAILSSPEKTAKFTKYESQGVDIVVGNYTDATSYEGTVPHSPFFSSIPKQISY